MSYSPTTTERGTIKKPIPNRGWNVIVIPDLQFPYHSEKSLQAVYDYVRHEDTMQFDEVIQLGDLMDFDYCSRWTKDNYRYLEGKRFEEDYEKARDFLDEFQEVFRENNNRIDFTFLEGNHDIRPKDVIDTNPQLEGMIEMHECLNFEDRDIFFMENWENNQLYQIGDAYFHHYPRKGSGTKHHAKGIVTRFGLNVFYGHLHDTQCFAKSNYGEDSTVVAQSLGVMAKYRQQYMGHSPSNWQHAFGTFHLRGDGSFNYYVYQINDHTFTTPDGREFSA